MRARPHPAAALARTLRAATRYAAIASALLPAALSAAPAPAATGDAITIPIPGITPAEGEPPGASPIDEAPPPPGQPPAANTYVLFAAEQLTHDDNLYRLPTGADLSALASPHATRADLIDSVSAGTDLHWSQSQQTVNLHVRLDDNRYDDNDNLDNTSTQDDLAWNWRLGERLSGDAGASYYRALTNFAGIDYDALDMVGRTDWYASARYRLGAPWTLFGGLDGAHTTLSAAPESIYDFHSTSTIAGLEFSSPSGNALSAEYRNTSARFPQVFVLNGQPFNSNYDENTALATLKYALTAATELQADAGYLRRTYPASAFAAFSGSIAHVSLDWQPSAALEVVLAGRHELKAYVDSEADYFVSNGATLEPGWKPAPALTLSVAFSYESHDYLGTSPSALTYAARRDTVVTQEARLTYTPAPFITAALAYQYVRRDSNHTVLEFDDAIATANITVKCRL